MSAEKKKRTRAKKKAAPKITQEGNWESIPGDSTPEQIASFLKREDEASSKAEKKRRSPHLEAHQIKPGQVLNPKGRPKGSRNKLGESFLTDLQADWQQHGAAVIETVRKDRPHEYLKVVASILPKELNVRVDPLDEMDDDELTAILAAARAAIRLHQEGGGEAGPTSGGKPPGVLLS